jgi:Co/Zn/Cd efflux system component
VGYFRFAKIRAEASSALAVAIVVTILAGAIVAGYESIQRLLHPQEVSYLWAMMQA